jgi:CRP/FNR family transcriptional regulator, cyclic AMP receptor protein
MNGAQKIQPLAAGRGTVIFREGEDANGLMFFIFDGEVEISKRGFGVLRTLGPGHFFGEMALVRSMPRTATAMVSSTGAKLGKIDVQTFAWLAKSNPSFLNNLIGVVAKRAARVMKKVADAGL